jgi:histone H3/H4
MSLTTGAGKRTKKRNYTFKVPTHAVLKTLDSKMEISGKASDVFQGIQNDFITRIASRAGEIVKASGGQTLNDRAVIAALQIELPGKLAQYAVDHVSKSVSKAGSARS